MSKATNTKSENDEKEVKSSVSLLENLQVLKILSAPEEWTAYKVRDKSSNKTYAMRAFRYEKCEGKLAEIVRKIDQRREQKHPNLIAVRDKITHEASKTLYVLLEDRQSLQDLLRDCKAAESTLSEPFLWLLLFKLATLLNKSQDCSIFDNLCDLFVNYDCKGPELDLQVLSFCLLAKSDNRKREIEKNKILLRIMQQMATLGSSEESDKLQNYSEDFRSLLELLETSNEDNLNCVLTHPTVLVQVVKMERNAAASWFNFEKSAVPSGGEELENEKPVDLQKKLQNLRRKEAQLKCHEGKLMEKQRDLERREKKVALAERIVKEKTARADLYLKCARKENLKPKQCALDMDTSLSAAETLQQPIATSKKLDVLNLKKPQRLRRVTFKTHSPLRDIHNLRQLTSPFASGKKFPNNNNNGNTKGNKTAKQSVSRASPKSKDKRKNGLEKTIRNLSALFSSASSSSSSLTTSSSIISNSKRAASSCSCDSSHTYEELAEVVATPAVITNTTNNGNANQVLVEKNERNEEATAEEGPEKRDVWTDESKRQAFQLLRLMNEEDDCIQIKHTFL